MNVNTNNQNAATVRQQQSRPMQTTVSVRNHAAYEVPAATSAPATRTTIHQDNSGSANVSVSTPRNNTSSGSNNRSVSTPTYNSRPSSTHTTSPSSSSRPNVSTSRPSSSTSVRSSSSGSSHSVSGSSHSSSGGSHSVGGHR